MTPLFLACSILAVPEPTAAVKLPPAMSLCLDVAEAVGARVQKLALVTDATITEVERAQIESALTKTGLFVLTEVTTATASLSVIRVDPSVLLATVAAADGTRLWVGRVGWEGTPTASARAVAPEPGPLSEITYKGVLRYKRDRVRVVPVTKGTTASPMVMGGWSSRWFGDPMPWGLGYGGGMPISDAPNDWLLMRGAADVLDELDFAHLVEDPMLVNRIEEARFWPELLWALGFGAGAVAGVGSGIWLAGFEDRDTRAVGVSLVTLGAVAAVLALMFPAAGPTHVLSPPEAQEHADNYNERLRAELGLTADDLARHLPEN
jgi:hypothetical protein